MSENIGNLTKKQQKDRIRERYKGVDPDMLEVIPAKKQADFLTMWHDGSPCMYAFPPMIPGRRLLMNCRRITMRIWWNGMSRGPGGVYADEGISGTSLKHRDSFNRMIADCKAGKIDMIITKSVRRVI